MKRLSIAWAGLAALAAITTANAAPPPRDYVFAGGSSAEEVGHLLVRPEIGGVQVVYNWRQLEPEEGRYDFSRIENDLGEATGCGKGLWIQLQDRFFRPQDRLLPDYILDDPKYGGGLAR